MATASFGIPDPPNVAPGSGPKLVNSGVASAGALSESEADAANVSVRSDLEIENIRSPKLTQNFVSPSDAITVPERIFPKKQEVNGGFGACLRRRTPKSTDGDIWVRPIFVSVARAPDHAELPERTYTTTTRRDRTT